MYKRPHPSWWVFYLIWLLMMVLLTVDYLMPQSERWHAFWALVIVGYTYALVVWWLRANRDALRREDLKRTMRHDARDAPLSPIQARYLEVIERSQLSKQVEHDSQRVDPRHGSD